MHGIILTGRLKKSIFWCVDNGHFKTFPAYNRHGKYSDGVLAYLAQNGLSEAEFRQRNYLGTPIQCYMLQDAKRAIRSMDPAELPTAEEIDNLISAILNE